MAININDYPNEIETGLKANKDYNKFLYRFKKDGITKRGIIDVSDKNWDKRTRISKAKSELDNLKSKEIISNKDFNSKSTLNKVAELYFSTGVENSQWNKELYDMYKLYVHDLIGTKKVTDIKKLQIDLVHKSMLTSGKSKQTVNGCSPRTIRKVIIQALKPVMNYALENGLIEKLPTFPDIKPSKKKKRVSEAGIKLATLFKTIMGLYKDDPFYRALFLFALYGRRWNEIRTLYWSDIDILNNTYTIRAENNKIDEEQIYDLPEPIKQALLEMQETVDGLIFKSPITNSELYPPKKQLSRIKEMAGIPELTMHYFRHILVSAMGEMGTATTILSASLGHTNLQTVNDYYLSANHTKGSVAANKMIGTIINNKED